MESYIHGIVTGAFAGAAVNSLLNYNSETGFILLAITFYFFVIDRRRRWYEHEQND